MDTDVYKRIVAAKMYMDDNLHKPIDLHQVSQKACFSPFHFHKLFTRIYRKTPHEYLTQVRIEAAKRLLRQNNTTVSQVCECVGFESLGSFSTLFKKRSGVSPLLFRERAVEKQLATEQQPARYIPGCLVSFFAPAEKQDSING